MAVAKVAIASAVTATPAAYALGLNVLSALGLGGLVFVVGSVTGGGRQRKQRVILNDGAKGSDNVHHRWGGFSLSRERRSTVKVDGLTCCRLRLSF